MQPIIENEIRITPREVNEDSLTTWYFNASDKSFHFNVYRFNDDLETVYLTNVFVKKEHRGKGLGNVILDITEEFALEIGANTVCLEAERNSCAYYWYKRHGYSYYAKDDDDKDFDWLEKKIDK